jgi:hypothetical protein
LPRRTACSPQVDRRSIGSAYFSDLSPIISPRLSAELKRKMRAMGLLDSKGFLKGSLSCLHSCAQLAVCFYACLHACNSDLPGTQNAALSSFWCAGKR